MPTEYQKWEALIAHIEKEVNQKLPKEPVAMTTDLLPWAYCKNLLGYIKILEAELDQCAEDDPA